MTKARKATLGVIQSSSYPLSTNEVYEKIDLKCDLATVYRALTYLENRNYLSSFVLHCQDHGTQRYYTKLKNKDGSANHHHWFHCEKCHNFIDLGSCKLEPLIENYQKEFDLSVREHTLYLVGTCSTCRTLSSNKSN
ncbi:MAG: Fur family transcriptional regulator [Sphaerochaetaceae bacterium]|jgi:Fur family ferric uptake transcriptional regulator